MADDNNSDTGDYYGFFSDGSSNNSSSSSSSSSSSNDPYANSYTYSGAKSTIDQVTNDDGTVTTYYSDGTSSTSTPTQGAQNVSTPSTSDLTTQIKNLFNGNTAGGAGQLAGLAGLYALLNTLGGGIGGTGSVYKGYTGGIPQYTGTRAQYGVPQQQIGTYGATAPATGGLPNVTPQQFQQYASNPNISPNQVADAMNRYGITTDQAAQALNVDPSVVQQKYNEVMGPNAQLGPYRPGQGGITYFTPMQYNLPAATPTPTPTPTTTTTTTGSAAGGAIGYAYGGGVSSLGTYSDGGRMLKGPGDGVSDSIPATIGGHQKAALADGEFVIPARIVSEIGNGSSDAGARKLYAMMDRIQNARKRTTKNVAANTKAEKYLPR